MTPVDFDATVPGRIASRRDHRFHQGHDRAERRRRQSRGAPRSTRFKASDGTIDFVHNDYTGGASASFINELGSPRAEERLVRFAVYNISAHGVAAAAEPPIAV